MEFWYRIFVNDYGIRVHIDEILLNEDCNKNLIPPTTQFCTYHVCLLTACNRTYYGEIGKTYELELHRPRENSVPYYCLITLNAAGGQYGDIIQVINYYYVP
ncbi:hypothetical protein AAG570_000559 [Ranatra chinensis]|uniref:Uncharacterized protein n=1 Tax=Ranatra chinensis TaxID=642074 RepID=A0ABD0YZG7_9HEMI